LRTLTIKSMASKASSFLFGFLDKVSASCLLNIKWVLLK
jgi:hypothetical protein